MEEYSKYDLVPQKKGRVSANWKDEEFRTLLEVWQQEANNGFDPNKTENEFKALIYKNFRSKSKESVRNPKSIGEKIDRAKKGYRFITVFNAEYTEHFDGKGWFELSHKDQRRLLKLNRIQIDLSSEFYKMVKSIFENEKYPFTKPRNKHSFKIILTQEEIEPNSEKNDFDHFTQFNSSNNNEDILETNPINQDLKEQIQNESQELLLGLNDYSNIKPINETHTPSILNGLNKVNNTSRLTQQLKRKRFNQIKQELIKDLEILQDKWIIKQRKEIDYHIEKYLTNRNDYEEDLDLNTRL